MTVSPLGRYAGPTGGGPLHRVQLLNLPVQLLLDGRDRHDALLRELALLAMSPAPQGTTPTRVAELSQLLGVRYGASQARPDALVDDAARRGQATVDLVYDVPSSVLDDAVRLESLMAEADALCLSEQLLTLPRTPLQVRFADWYLGELRRQVGGAPPEPWDGPLDV